MNKNKLQVLFDTTPLTNANAVRGVGIYTKLLFEQLRKLEQLTILKAGSAQSKKEKFNLIHYPFFDLFFPTLPLVSANKRVVTIHDVIPLLFPKHYPVGIKGNLAFQKQKMALKTVQAVITDSQSSQKDIIQHLHLPAKKIHVVPLAGNPEIYQAEQKEITKVKKRKKLPDQYLLYVGDINYNKNLPQLIKAVKYLPEELELVMVGKSFVEQNIPEWQWITSQIELSAVKERVTMLADVKDSKELSAIYSGAFCYVQPSLYEGFGLPILEAMQARVPVVSCRNSSLIEVGAGHVVFADCAAEALADGVKQVLSWSDKKRTDVIKKASTWAATFSWEKTALETLKVYQSIL